MRLVKAKKWAELRDFVDNIMVRAVVELQKKPTEASDTLV